MKEYPEGFVLKTNTAVLSSLVFEPQSYLGGIQAMKAISLNYNEWTVKTSDATPTKTGEVWQRNTTKVNVLTPKIVAYYHVNPQNISESQIVEKSVHYVADNKEVVTRSQEFNPTVTSYKLVDKEIDGKNCRMLKVTFSATSEEIKALDAKEVSTLALQVSVQLKDEKEPRVITSDYAAIYKTNWSDFVLAFKDKVNNNATNDGHLYGADDNDSKIGQALEAIEAEANFALTATVDAKDPKKLVLKDKFTFHYKETADKTDADPSEEKVFEGDLADLDLEIAFAQSNYISGDNKTPQNAFLKLEDGEAISTVYGEPGVAAADRQPMVRVMLREIATKKVLNAGWVKINIVKDDVDGKEIDYPKHEEIYVGCDDAAVTTDVQFMNVDVYNALGLKKDEFLSNCSSLDDVIIFFRDGRYIVTPVSDKKFVGKNILYANVFKKNDKRTIYNVVYRDGKEGTHYIKRFAVTSIIRDREYDVTQGTPDSRIMYFTANPNGEAEVIKVTLKPNPRVRRIIFEEDFSAVGIKGRQARGNILTKLPVHKIALKQRGGSTLGGRKVWFDRDVLRLNYDGRGEYLGEFQSDDSILVVHDNGDFYITNFDLSNHYEANIRILEKFDPNKIWTAVLYDTDQQNFPYIKRFCMEATNRKQNYLGENKNNRLILLTDECYPRLEIIFGGHDSFREPMIIEADEFIAVKGFKAKGKRITTFTMETVNELEPTRQPEVSQDTEDQEEEEPENLDPDHGKSEDDIRDEITGQMKLF